MTNASRTYLRSRSPPARCSRSGSGCAVAAAFHLVDQLAHRVGYATISLAFGIAQLMWGVAQPIAGAIADRHGSRPVMIAGALLLCLATALTPFATSATALIVLIGFIGLLGAGAFGPALLMSAANRWIPAVKRSFASGVVNAGGSFGQFTLVPFAQLLIGLAGWQPR
jgi:MFS family permease